MLSKLTFAWCAGAEKYDNCTYTSIPIDAVCLEKDNMFAENSTHVQQAIQHYQHYLATNDKKPLETFMIDFYNSARF